MGTAEKMVVVLMALVAAVAALGGDEAGSDKAIFLLAGQSNMAGRGGTYELGHWDGRTPSQCLPNQRIIRLNGALQWEEAREPLNQNISLYPCPLTDHAPGVGPGIPFANALLEAYPAIGTVGLVPCAVGNTEISQWERGSCLYNRLLGRARASLRDGGSIHGMLWFQGESDCKPGLADAYEDRLKAFFNDIRNDLMLPLLPIIQVALDSTKDDPDVKKIRDVQLNLKLPNLRCVDALGLPLNGDGLHLTTDSQVTLGSMMAEEFIENFI